MTEIASEAEIYAHCKETFDNAYRSFPDLMDPYIVMLAEAADLAERLEIMRSGLRNTIKIRYPLRTTESGSRLEDPNA